jgi:Flp pilus assembly pilin Flp
MNEVLVRLQLLLRERTRGQTMAEYVVVLGVISVALLLAMMALSGGVSSALGKVTADI